MTQANFIHILKQSDSDGPVIELGPDSNAHGDLTATEKERKIIEADVPLEHDLEKIPDGTIVGHARFKNGELDEIQYLEEYRALYQCTAQFSCAYANGDFWADARIISESGVLKFKMLSECPECGEFHWAEQ